MKINLPDFSQANVFVYGDLMLDRYWRGQTARISPEAPVPVVNVNDIEDRVGGAANVALNAAVLGANVKLSGVMGEDERAEAIIQILDEAGISQSIATDPAVSTITKLRILSRHQQLIRVDFEQGPETYCASVDTEAFAKHIVDYDVVVLSDYNKGSLTQSAELIALAKAAGKPVFVDPKGDDFTKYSGATLLTPNQSEFEAVVGACPTEADLIEKGLDLISSLSLEALLITRSEKGMLLLQKHEQPFIQSTYAQDVFDVTGAGDTVIATLAAAVAAGASLVQATQVANLAASVVVGKLGTSTVSTQELHAAMFRHKPQSKGVLSEDALLESIAQAKQAGETIVMTNGCFDLLHSGHVAYLQEAAKLGDKLIVAVNSDESVKQLKGPTRPVNSISHRMLVLAGLDSVDWVVAFSEETPARLIARCLPDVLVKGGDYKPEDIAGGDVVVANGGRVEVLNFVDGVSTSQIIKEIQEHAE